MTAATAVYARVGRAIMTIRLRRIRGTILRTTCAAVVAMTVWTRVLPQIALAAGGQEIISRTGYVTRSPIHWSVNGMGEIAAGVHA